MGCERSRVLLLLLFLLANAHQRDFDQSSSRSSYLSPCRDASKPNFAHASCKTSARGLTGVVLITVRRADESRTTTWEAIWRRLKPGGTCTDGLSPLDPRRSEHENDLRVQDEELLTAGLRGAGEVGWKMVWKVRFVCAQPSNVLEQAKRNLSRLRVLRPHMPRGDQNTSTDLFVQAVVEGYSYRPSSAMAPPEVHHLFHHPISDHSFSADRQTLAVARDNNVELYSRSRNKFTLQDELKGHDKTVTSVDIASKSGRIVTCSQGVSSGEVNPTKAKG